MGSCKEEMKKTEVEKTTKKGLFSKLSKKKGESKEEIAETVADYLTLLEEKVASLIDIKDKELDEEKGREDYNRRAKGKLETMYFHIDKAIEVATEYGEDN